MGIHHISPGIHLRGTGKVFVFSADVGFWAFTNSQLLCCQCHLMERPLMSPKPILADHELINGAKSRRSLIRVNYSGYSI